MPASAASKLVCVAVVTAAHGVRGAFRLKTFTVEPEGVAAYGPVLDDQGAVLFPLRIVGPAQGGVIVTAPGIADRDAAEALRGMRLHVPRERLPKPDAEEFYHQDLVGLLAVGEAGEVLGRVSAVHNFGAGDVLELAADGGRSEVLPFTREVVPEIDVTGGRLVVRRPGEIVAAPEADQ